MDTDTTTPADADTPKRQRPPKRRAQPAKVRYDDHNRPHPSGMSRAARRAKAKFERAVAAAANRDVWESRGDRAPARQEYEARMHALSEALADREAGLVSELDENTANALALLDADDDPHTWWVGDVVARVARANAAMLTTPVRPWAQRVAQAKAPHGAAMAPGDA